MRKAQSQGWLHFLASIYSHRPKKCIAKHRDGFKNLKWTSIELLTMSGPELLSLKWKDFQENLRNEFASLKESQDFTDVTLACEDGLQVEAHKLILAATSPFFQDLFKRNRHEYSLIYMRGVKSEDLVAIVDFLYYGEVNVHQDNLEAFLALAEELRLKGLTEPESKGDNKEIQNLTEPDDDKSKLLIPKMNEQHDPPKPPEKLDNSQMSEASSQTKTEEKNVTKGKGNKEKQENQFPCLLCNKKYRTYNHLNTHKMKEHEEKKYMCEQCEFQSSWLSNFLTHKQSKHEGK